MTDQAPQRAVHSVEELLPAFVAGGLAPEQARVVESHLEGCESCRASQREWELVSAASHRVAVRTPEPSRGVLDRAFLKVDEVSRSPGWRERWLPGAFEARGPRRVLAGLGVAAVLGLAIGFTPIGSYAQGILDVMRPQQFAVVPVTEADLRALPSLDLYGDFSVVQPGGPPKAVASRDEAATATGMTVLVPSALPASVSASAQYLVVPSQSATFTFDAEKARAAAASNGKPLPPMPANIDGSSVQMTTGMAVVGVYGGVFAMLDGTEGSNTPGAPSVNPGAPGEAAVPDLDAAVPQLIVAQMIAPVATATGVSSKELQRYLMSQPGISDNLSNAIRAIGDPTTTWPIPVPAGEVRTRSVNVQGVRGTSFTDTSGLFSGVLWLKDGVIHAVAAPLGEREVLKIAASLR